MNSISVLEDALATAPERIEEAQTSQDLDEVEATLIGKSSIVGEVRRSIGSLDPKERPVVGSRLSEVTAEIEQMIARRRTHLENVETQDRLSSDAIDVTLERVHLRKGSIHLIQQTIDEIVDIFVGLGYQMATGPEAELAWYNFDALNTPRTHPSRLESDTMYLEFGEP